MSEPVGLRPPFPGDVVPSHMQQSGSSGTDPWFLHGQQYRDVYKVVIDTETRPDWSTVLVQLKSEFHQFMTLALQTMDGGIPVIRGRLAPAHEVHHHGNGYMETDKRLLRLTTQRMLDNGVALDLICLCRPPLHATPVFLITSKFPSTEHHVADEPRTSRAAIARDRRAEAWDPLYYDDDRSDNPEYLFFTVPDWIDVSYVYQSSSIQFNPRMRMPALALNTIDVPRVEPIVPFLDDGELEDYDARFRAVGWILEWCALADVDDAMPSTMTNGDGGGTGAKVGVLSTSLTITSPIATALHTGGFHTQIPRVNSDSSIGQHYHQQTGSSTATVSVPRSTSPSASASYLARTAAMQNSYRRNYAEEMAASRRTNESGHLRMAMANNGHESYESVGGLASAAATTMPNAGGAYLGALETIPDADDHSAPTGSGQYVSRAIPLSNASLQASGMPGSANLTPIGASPRRYNQYLVGSQLTRMASTADHRASSHLNVPGGDRGAAGNVGSGGGGGGGVGGGGASGSHPAPGTSPTHHGASSFTSSYLSMQLRPNLVSPWHPKRNVMKLSSHLQRWHHVYPQQASIRVAVPFWNSLCTPACLPVTTDSFPTAEELMDLYQEYTYTVSPSDAGAGPMDNLGGTSFPPMNRSGAHALLTQMISLRLSQGFQIVLTSAGTATPFGAQDTFLSMGHHLHRLSVLGDQNVEVKRYVRKLHYVMKPITYKLHLWSRDDGAFVHKSIKFEYPQLAMFNWNYVDHLLSENDDEGDTDTFHLYRARFAFIPMDHVPTSINTMTNEHLDDEELRIAGFQRLLETLQKHVTDGSQLRAQLTSLTRSAHVRAEVALRTHEQQQAAAATAASNVATSPSMYAAASALGMVAGTLRRGSISGLLATDTLAAATASTTASSSKLTKDSKPVLIAHAMQNLSTGVKFSDRRWHLRLYERVFVGSECVDWMLRSISDVDTREDAVALGNSLLQQGVFVHVLQKHSFMDGHYFYRLRPDLYLRQGDEVSTGSSAPMPLPSTAASVTGTGWFRSRHSSNGEELHNANGGGGGGGVGVGAAAHSIATITSGKSHPSNTGAHLDPGAGSISMASTTSMTIGSTLVIPPTASTSHAVSALLSRTFNNHSSSTDPMEARVELARKVSINLDLGQKSDRKQLAVMHIDTVHNPHHVFSIQLHWLTCTTWRIAETLSQWSRIGEKCGLRLAQVPIDQVKLMREHEDANPFHTQTIVKLATLPPTDPPPPHGAPLYYEAALVKSFGFVLDIEADDKFPPMSTKCSYDPRRPVKYSQYVHRSGSAFILLRPASEGLIWIPNPLLLTTVVQSATRAGGTAAPSSSTVNSSSTERIILTGKECCKSSMNNVEVLRTSFIHFTRDESALGAFWLSVADQLRTGPLPAAVVEELEQAPEAALVTVGVPAAAASAAAAAPTPSASVPKSASVQASSAASSTVASPMVSRHNSTSRVNTEDSISSTTRPVTPAAPSTSAPPVASALTTASPQHAATAPSTPAVPPVSIRVAMALASTSATDATAADSSSNSVHSVAATSSTTATQPSSNPQSLVSPNVMTPATVPAAALQQQPAPAMPVAAVEPVVRDTSAFAFGGPSFLQGPGGGRQFHQD
ncbi:hypothetical protein BCR44DRAFT_1441039 [Catenaria anguillulae PL171]|uniref:Vacuolar membrane-associated protein IML1 n=1 Tax=Catenaria anguillulae PL171 TaxID=765915 RepID=A0A1Y2HG98_9FUNG|nr:hypothetical protein BCR44DRAFT_1441039 [Catenaria anguillulae PL171]